MLRNNRLYRFQKSPQKQSFTIADFTTGMDTKSPEVGAKVRVAKNARISQSSGFDKRKGSLQKGNQIGTTTGITGLHGFEPKNSAAQIVASYNTDLYKFTETASPITIATSTNAQATGYPKDRKVFFTSANLDASSKPWMVVLYQSGAGILLEWSAYPYTAWANAPITVNASTQLGFAGHMDSSDNLHIAFMDTANSTRYVKLTYAAGPTWSVGSTVLVRGTGASDQAIVPSITRQSTGRIHIVYRYYNGSTYSVNSKYSDDGTTFSTEQSIASSVDANTYPALTINSDVPYLVTQEVEVGGTTYTSYSFTGTTWGVGSTLGSSLLSKVGFFSIVPYGSSVKYIASELTTSNGISLTTYGTVTNSTRRNYEVVNDGASDNDIQYKNVIEESTDITATRVSNDSLNNLYPVTAEQVSVALGYTPVMFVSGTASPYNIKVNSSAQWASLGTTVSATKVVSAMMPLTAAGGTDQLYFVDGTNLPKKWDGTTVTTATAAGMPTPSFIFAMDNRLLMDNVSDGGLRYTNLGADNFAGTFPSTNRVDFPEKCMWGHYYRDRVGLIFTRQGVYSMSNFDYTGQNVAAETFRKIPDSYGILSGRTVKQIGYWVYYQRPDGQIMRTNSQYAELVSDAIAPTLSAISLANLANAAAGSYGDFYYLSVTDSGNAQNNLIITLDTRVAPKGGFTIDTGKYASCFLTIPDRNNVPTIYYGDSRSSYGNVYQMEIGKSDNGSAIDMDVQTGVVVMSGIQYKDTLNDLLVVAETSGEYNLTISYSKLTNLNSFRDYTVSLDTNAGKWGTGVWGTGTWGGNTHIEQEINGIDTADRGFKFRFRNNAADQDVSFISLTGSYTPLVDKP